VPLQPTSDTVAEFAVTDVDKTDTDDMEGAFGAELSVNSVFETFEE